MKKVLSVVLVGVMALSLMACGAKDEVVPEVNENTISESQETQSEDNQAGEIVEKEPESEISEGNLDNEVADADSDPSSITGRTYKKDDGSTLEVLGVDSAGYINAINLNGVEFNLANIQLFEGHYGPEENTYLGDFNSNGGQIGISYFTNDDSQLIIRFFGVSSDEVDITKDGAYYLE